MVDVLESAGIPRIGLGPTDVSEFSSSVSYPISAGIIAAYIGTAVGFKQDGNTKICLIRTDAPTGATFRGFLTPMFSAVGVDITCDVAVATGATDYAPYIAEVQRENPDAVLISHSDSVATQLIGAMTQLNAKIPLGGNPGTFTLATLRKYRDLMKGTVVSESFPYPAKVNVKNFPGLKKYFADMKASGKKDLSAAKLKTTDFSPWIATLAFVNVTKDLDSFTPATVVDALKNAKDVDLLGLTPAWTPSTPGFSVFTSSSNHYVYVSRFNGKNVVTDKEAVDVTQYVKYGWLTQVRDPHVGDSLRGTVAQAVQFAILGLGAGAAYTLLAQGIVLIYRGSGIVNFAHGAIAMFGAFFCFLTLVEQHGWPVEAAIPVAVLLAALLGVVIQNGVLRFMGAAAPLVRLVATLGVLIVLQGLAGQKLWDSDFHQVDQFLPTHNYTLHGWFGFDGELGRVVIQQDRLILVGIAIALTIALWAFTRFTKLGLAISASAENERAVSALGWSPNFLATVTWAIGGATAGLAGILLAPNAGLSLTVFTIVVTVSALAVALIGGFSSFPLTLLGGIALGIAESEVLTYSSDISTFLHDTFGIENGATGLQRALPFLVIVVVLVVRGKALPLRSHVLERLPDLGSGVVTRWFLVVTVGGLLLLNGFAFDVQWSTAVYTTLIVGVFILSIVVLTGYAGQLSLARVRDRWPRRPRRVSTRGTRELAGRARIPRGCGLRHPRRSDLRRPCTPHPWRESCGRHPRARVRGPAGGVQQPVLHR